MAISLQLELMPEEEKVLAAPPPKTLVVRYGYLKMIGEFVSDLPTKVGCGTKVVIRTERGTEIAEMLTTTCTNGGCTKSVTREKMLSYIEASGGAEYPFSTEGRVIRVATTVDLAEQAKLDENRHPFLLKSRELVGKHQLDMKIVDVEFMLGRERVMFYFTSEHRVDFRSLVREMAHEFHCRIELRQVGARDEARLVADYEKCGQHCCCKSFLKVLTPISMRAAKVQKATLDPTKISGRCGRLMCCLRYEDETYEELRKKLPKRNTRVRTEKGEGWVVDGQILTQLVMVLFDEDRKREAVPMEKIVAFDLPKPLGADGRPMQSPNDRPPEEFRGAGDLAGPPAGRPGERPRPGRPAGVVVGAGGPGGSEAQGGGDAAGENIGGTPMPRGGVVGPRGPMPPRGQGGARPPMPPRGPQGVGRPFVPGGGQGTQAPRGPGGPAGGVQGAPQGGGPVRQFPPKGPMPPGLRGGPRGGAPAGLNRGPMPPGGPQRPAGGPGVSPAPKPLAESGGVPPTGGPVSGPASGGVAESPAAPVLEVGQNAVPSKSVEAPVNQTSPALPEEPLVERKPNTDSGATHAEA